MDNFNWLQLQNGSDIRGVALTGVPGEEVNLTAEVVAILGKSFVTWLSNKIEKETSELVISVGRDSRLSGADLIQTLMTGIAECGCQVYDFAIASTPAMFMSTIHPDFNCDGAIMLTASHLPFNRNGLKFFSKRGGLEKQDITAILELAQKSNFQKSSTEPPKITESDFITIYGATLADKIREDVVRSDNYQQPLKGLKIVVDAGNGAGGFYVDKVLKPLGADTTGSQFLEPDGNFPNHIPNPENAEAMAAISQAVLANKADFGIIFDTDVDRVAAVDHKGNELNRNRLIALISAIILQEHPGSTIVTDSITSDGLTQFIEQLGGVHHRFKRGYKNVINEAVALNKKGQESWLAIETSGHAAMKENYFLDDGAYLATKLLAELAKANLENKLITDLIAHLEEPKESQEFRLKIDNTDFKEYGNKVINKLQKFAATQSDWEIVPNNYEGVRIACKSPQEDGWFLLRLSLHDPVIPLNIESNVTGGVKSIVTKLLTFFEEFDSLELSSLKSFI